MVKNLPANVGDTGDLGSIPGWGRSPGGGNGNALQYFCLENSMDKGVWQAIAMVLPRVRHNWATEHSTQHSILLNYLVKMASSYNGIISSCPFLDKFCHIMHMYVHIHSMYRYIYNLHEAESFHSLPPPSFASWFTPLNFRILSLSNLFPSHFSYFHSVATTFSLHTHGRDYWQSEESIF